MGCRTMGTRASEMDHVLHPWDSSRERYRTRHMDGRASAVAAFRVAARLGSLDCERQCQRRVLDVAASFADGPNELRVNREIILLSR